MDIFTAIWEGWTTHQKNSLLLLCLCTFIVLVSAVSIITRNKRLIIHTIFSIITSSILTVVALLLLHIIFDEKISYVYMLTPTVVFLMNIISLSSNLGYYTSHKNKKGFSSSELKKEMLRDSLQYTIFVILLFSSVSLFLSGVPFTFAITTGIVCLVLPWVNYSLLYWLYR